MPTFPNSQSQRVRRPSIWGTGLVIAAIILVVLIALKFIPRALTEVAAARAQACIFGERYA